MKELSLLPLIFKIVRCDEMVKNYYPIHRALVVNLKSPIEHY
jgi:hypothetical protein